MGKHAVYSPSGAGKWMSCRGSTAMEKGMPNPSSKYSDEGTAAHFLASEALNAPDTDFYGKTILVLNDESAVWLDDDTHHEASRIRSSWDVDHELMANVQVYIDQVYALCDDDTELYVEVSLPLFKVTGEDATGTADAIVINGEHLSVIDLKFGRGIEVAADQNSQLMIYALAAIDFFEPDHNKHIEHVSLCISQPRKESFSQWEISRTDLEAFREKVMYAAQMAQTIVAANHDLEPEEMHHSKQVLESLTAGDHCRKGFCRARGKCPALANKVMKAMDVTTFEDLTSIPKPSIDDMTLLAYQANTIPLIESWCKGVRGLVESSLYAGKKVAGWKVVMGKQGNRSWVTKQDAEKEMKKLDIPHDKMYSYKLSTPPMIEKMLKEGRVTNKQWDDLQPLVTRAAGVSSVALESDPREAIDVTPPAFADITKD